MHHDVLARAAELAIDYLDRLPERSMVVTRDGDGLRAALGGPFPEHGEPARQVVERLAAAAEAGIVGSAAPRFFGFVIGGGIPAAVGADWLTSAWDQNSGLFVLGPALAVVEETVGKWLVELFGLPAGTSAGFVTGCQMANFTALAAARHAVLARVGWDVERRGLAGAPTVDVVIGEEAHVTAHIALQFLGMGNDTLKRVPTDDQGRMRADALRDVLAGCHGPTIVVCQAGNVNTGSFDPFAEIVPLVRELEGAWLHVDGAFGMWAAAVPSLETSFGAARLADSWATDAHKWLNVPYDSGIVFIADPDAHRAAMALPAGYLVSGEGRERDGYEWVPELSRRGRGFAVYAALKQLGRDGIVELVERNCRQARRFVERLRELPGVRVLNDVVLNQVLVRFEVTVEPNDAAASDALTRDVVRRVQEDGTCWLGGTTWHGMAAMRISVSNWATSDADVERSADAIVRCAAAARAAAS